MGPPFSSSQWDWISNDARDAPLMRGREARGVWVAVLGCLVTSSSQDVERVTRPVSQNKVYNFFLYNFYMIYLHSIITLKALISYDTYIVLY